MGHILFSKSRFRFFRIVVFRFPTGKRGRPTFNPPIAFPTDVFIDTGGWGDIMFACVAADMSLP
jgi:hypothetical protein